MAILRKLADFKGQEHITSVLRASIIKGTPLTEIAIDGPQADADELFVAYLRALNCSLKTKGDACLECGGCRAFYSGVLAVTKVYSLPYWQGQLVTDATTLSAARDRILYCYHGYTANFTNFTLRSAKGAYLNRDAIKLVIFGVCGERGNVLQTASNMGKYCTLTEFCTLLLDVFRTVMYLNHNLEVVETENLDVLRKAAPGVHAYVVNAVIKLLLENIKTTAIPDELAISSLAVLIANALSPIPVPSYTSVMSGTSETPIMIVEESTGQALNIEEMLRIAHE